MQQSTKASSLIVIAVCLLTGCTLKSAYDTHMEAGRSAYLSGHYVEAASQFLAASRDAEKETHGEQRQATSLNELAKSYLKQRDRYMEAEPILAKAEKLREKANPSNVLACVEVTNNQALDYFLQSTEGYTDGHVGNFDDKRKESKQLYEMTLELAFKIGPSARTEEANSLAGLAKVSSAELKYKDALSYIQRALVIRQKDFGADSRIVATTLRDEAEITFRSDRGDHTPKNLAAAEKLYMHALTIQKKLLGSDHPDLAKTLDGLGQVYQCEKKYKDAEASYRQAMQIDERNASWSGTSTDSEAHLAGLYDEYDAKARLKDNAFRRR